MARVGFERGSWVERLARSLEKLAAVQEGYREELYGQESPGMSSQPWDLSERLQGVYRRASRGTSVFLGRHYRRVLDSEEKSIEGAQRRSHVLRRKFWTRALEELRARKVVSPRFENISPSRETGGTLGAGSKVELAATVGSESIAPGNSHSVSFKAFKSNARTGCGTFGAST